LDILRENNRFMKFILSLLFLLIFQYSQAQVRTLEKGILYWTGYYVEWGLSDRFQLDAEVDNRRIFTPSQQFQTLVRTTFYFKNSQSINFGAGIGYAALYSIYTPTVQSEIRPHQEVNYNHGLDRISFNHRIRLEQRFREDTTRTILPTGEIREENSTTRSFDFRTRYELALDVSMLDKNNKRGHLNLQLASELMIQRWDEWFDTTRFYAGFQYFVSPKIRLELGYLNSVEKEFTYDRKFSYDNIRFTLRQRL
jgi:hypothetical protein